MTVGAAALRDAALREHEAAVAAAGTHEQDLSFGGRRVRLRAAGRELLAALLPAFAARRIGTGGTPDVTIALWEVDVARSVEADPLAPGRLAFGANRLAEDPGAAVVVARPAGSDALTIVDRGGRLLLQRHPRAADLPSWERAAPLRSALDWALAGPDRGLVHAGCVGRRATGGVLLVGGSGSGKSTVALAALEGGLDYVADDYTLLRRGPVPSALNVYGTAKLERGHADRFPALWQLARRPATADDKAAFHVSAHRPSALAEALDVRAIVLPRIRGGRAATRAVSTAAALRAFAPSTALQLPYRAAEVLSILADACRRVPCFELDVGDRPEELSRAVDDILTSAACAG